MKEGGKKREKGKGRALDAPGSLRTTGAPSIVLSVGFEELHE